MVLLVHGVIQPLASKVPLIQTVAKHLSIPKGLIEDINIVRRSVDARKRRGNTSAKVSIRLVYNVHVHLRDKTRESKLTSVKGGTVARIVEEIKPYTPMIAAPTASMNRPIVIGSGPAGLFAAYTLVCSGFKPIVIEMGPHVERRSKDIMKFWKEGVLTPNSNGVFGEGGAGAFSDGKLTTRTSSAYHRFVHETLIKYGAKPNILYESRAHVGTDQLRKIITNFSRDGIAAAGATFLYNTQLDRISRCAVTGAIESVTVRPQALVDASEVAEFHTSFDQLVNDKSIINVAYSSNNIGGDGNSVADAEAAADIDDIEDNDGVTTNNHSRCSHTPHVHPSIPLEFTLQASDVFLATGHSARPLFQHLYDVGANMSRKNFAVGLRLQISQKYVNRIQYGDENLVGNSGDNGSVGDRVKHGYIEKNNDDDDVGVDDVSGRRRTGGAGTGTRADGRSQSDALATLGPAEFTLKYADHETGRNVYTFCMCPGGVIVNASHGEEEMAINGMSYSTRASRFANAAIVVTVRSEDFDGYERRTSPGTGTGVGVGVGASAAGVAVGDAKLEQRSTDALRAVGDNMDGDNCIYLSHRQQQQGDGGDDNDDHPLRGMYFQQYWEHQCFRAAGGSYSAPAQRVTDYLYQYHHRHRIEQQQQLWEKNKGTTTAATTTAATAVPFVPDQTLPDSIFMGQLQYANLHQVLPNYINTAIVNALCQFSKSMPLITGRDTLLVGIESRTSSPVRIDRNEVTLESTNIKGLYPVGEGAGYAGGIMTACVDGVRAVEAMIAQRCGDVVDNVDYRKNDSSGISISRQKCIDELKNQQQHSGGGGGGW